MNPEELFRGESETIEYKASVASKSEAYMKTVIAFANGRGGQLLFGVQDISGEALGLGRKTVFKYMDAVANAIASKCEPRIHPHIYLYEIDRKPIIIVDVPPGAETPYWIQGEGIENGTYIRVGATTRKADRYRIEELILRGQHKFFDQELTDYIIKDNQAREFCEDMYEFVRARHAAESEDQRKVGIGQLLSWGMLHEADHHFYASNGYLLMNGPSDKFTDTGIQCAVYKGGRRGHVVTRSEYDGRFYDNIECAVNFITAHLMDRDTNGELYERSRLAALPQRSIREIVVNAVCHRSYQTPGKIQIGIFDDKIEVVSPGGLDCSLAVEDIMNGRSRVRNPAIANALRYIGMFEGWGNGIPQVMADAAENGLPAPIFRARPGDFVVRLSATEEEAEDVEDAAESIIPITDAVRIPVVALSEPSDSEVGAVGDKEDEYEFIPYEALGGAEKLLSFDSVAAQSAQSTVGEDAWEKDIAMADEVNTVLTGALHQARKKDASRQQAIRDESGPLQQSKNASGTQSKPQNAKKTAAQNGQSEKARQQNIGRGVQQEKGQQEGQRKAQSQQKKNTQQGQNGAKQKQQENSAGSITKQKGQPNGASRKPGQNAAKAQQVGNDKHHEQNGSKKNPQPSSAGKQQDQGETAGTQKAQGITDEGQRQVQNWSGQKKQQPGSGKQKKNAANEKPQQTMQEALVSAETGHKSEPVAAADDKPGDKREQKDSAAQTEVRLQTDTNSAQGGNNDSRTEAANGSSSKRRRSRRSRKRAQERAAELEAMLDSETDETPAAVIEPAAAPASEQRTSSPKRSSADGSVLSQLTDTQRRVYELLRENPKLTQTALSRSMSLSVTSVRRALDALIEKNLVRREGGRRYGEWIALDPS